MKRMNLIKFSKEVHENAVAHGWWDEDRGILEITALIHSEWSEALEEYRAGRPMVWYECAEGSDGEHHVCESIDEYDCAMHGKEDKCKWRGKKPEGIAVELIDGCIRILDLFGKFGIETLQIDDGISMVPEIVCRMSLPDLVACLHYETSKSTQDVLDNTQDEQTLYGIKGLCNAMFIACAWVKHNGIDPEAIMLEKHEYNKGRPYKHGGKVC